MELGAVVVRNTFTKNIVLYVNGFDIRNISIVNICIIIHRQKTSFWSVRSAIMLQNGSPKSEKWRGKVRLREFVRVRERESEREREGVREREKEREREIVRERVRTESEGYRERFN